MTLESSCAHTVQRLGAKARQLEDTQIFEQAKPDPGESLAGFHSIAKGTGEEFNKGAQLTMPEDQLRFQTVAENFRGLDAEEVDPLVKNNFV